MTGAGENPPCRTGSFRAPALDAGNRLHVPEYGGPKVASEEGKQWGDELLNPDTVRTKLFMIGLFMVAHELLEETLKRPPLSFFADKWKDGKPVQNDVYKTEVLKLDPKGKPDYVRTSCSRLRTGAEAGFGPMTWRLAALSDRFGGRRTLPKAQSRRSIEQDELGA